MVLDTREYVSLLRELTNQGREVRLEIAGNSMAPFLCDGRDSVFFSRPDTPLRVGDIVFYQRKQGQMVLHRICKIRSGQLYLAGDAQTLLEGPVPEEAVFARVNRVLRKGQLLRPGLPCWEFFSGVWRWCRPMRRKILGIYAAQKRLRKNRS